MSRITTPNLPTKLLLLTIAFIMIAEVLIFVPSVANYRRNWLVERLNAAQIASLSLEAAESGTLPARLRYELLNTAGVHAVSLKRNDFRQLVLQMSDNRPISAVYDLREPSFLTLIMDGLHVFLVPRGRFIRVLDTPEMGAGGEIDIVIDETPLKVAVWKFAKTIFWLSLIISVFTATLVYLALNALLVRPMTRITRNMVYYSEDPEDVQRVIKPSGRRDEIGIAERELAAMQSQLSVSLKERRRLAAIGLAVSKINHDLRNMLSSAQLVSDRLTAVSDPTVQRFAPRLIRALDRAIALCINVLAYGRSEEAPSRPTYFPLLLLVEEVAESLGFEDQPALDLETRVDPALQIWADRDQLFRVLSNISRNAVEAMREQPVNGEPPRLRIAAQEDEGLTVIRISDNGPGVPPAMRPNLFKAFHTTTRKYGSGLGLAISAELVQAHGGSLVLEDTHTGASFLLTLPIDGARAETEA